MREVAPIVDKPRSKHRDSAVIEMFTLIGE